MRVKSIGNFSSLRDRSVISVKLWQDFLLMEPKIHAVDGREVVNKIKENIEMLMRKKVMAVKVCYDQNIICVMLQCMKWRVIN